MDSLACSAKRNCSPALISRLRRQLPPGEAMGCSPPRSCVGDSAVQTRGKKDTLIPYPWDESMLCFVVPPRFGGGFLPCGPRLSGRLPAISARGALYARSADVLRACCRRELSANAPLSARLSAVLLPRHSDEIVQRSPRFCRLTIRQSRSPRCRPRISISAEARFVAHGTL